MCIRERSQQDGERGENNNTHLGVKERLLIFSVGDANERIAQLLLQSELLFAYIHTYIHTYRQTGRQTDRHTYRQTGRRTDRQAGRQTQ